MSEFNQSLYLSFRYVRTAAGQGKYPIPSELAPEITQETLSEEYFALLESRGLYKEACCYLAYVLQKRVVGAWLAFCMKTLRTEVAEPEENPSLSPELQNQEKKVAALSGKTFGSSSSGTFPDELQNTVRQWVMTPDEVNSLKLKEYSETSGNTQGALLAAVLYWLYDNLTPLGDSPTLPPAGLASAGAVLLLMRMARVQNGTRSETERWSGFWACGKELLCGIYPWK